MPVLISFAKWLKTLTGDVLPSKSTNGDKIQFFILLEIHNFDSGQASVVATMTREIEVTFYKFLWPGFSTNLFELERK